MPEQYDAGDEAKVKDARVSARDKDRLRKEAICAIMDVPACREYLWELLEFCKTFQSPFASNALVMAHNAGEQNVGFKILADITDAAPAQYINLLEEKKNARSRRRSSGSPADLSSGNGSARGQGPSGAPVVVLGGSALGGGDSLGSGQGPDDPDNGG